MAGVSVLGTDIGVSGAVKVGIGAHAEVGYYTDGKFKVDVGAALGVGVDIGFGYISGTVDAVAGWLNLPGIK